MFVSWLLDRHPDHLETALALATQVPRGEGAPLIAAYESMTPLLANHSVDITAVSEGKNELTRLYASQQRRYACADVVDALNGYRARLLRRPGIRAAECFHVTTAEGLVKVARSLFTMRS